MKQLTQLLLAPPLDTFATLRHFNLLFRRTEHSLFDQRLLALAQQCLLARLCLVKLVLLLRVLRLFHRVRMVQLVMLILALLMMGVSAAIVDDVYLVLDNDTG